MSLLLYGKTNIVDEMKSLLFLMFVFPYSTSIKIFNVTAYIRRKGHIPRRWLHHGSRWGQNFQDA